MVGSMQKAFLRACYLEVGGEKGLRDQDQVVTFFFFLYSSSIFLEHLIQTIFPHIGFLTPLWLSQHNSVVSKAEHRHHQVAFHQKTSQINLSLIIAVDYTSNGFLRGL